MATWRELRDGPLRTVDENIPLEDLANLWATDRRMQPDIRVALDQTFDARMREAVEMPRDPLAPPEWVKALAGMCWAFSHMDANRQTPQRLERLTNAVNALDLSGRTA
jgi:hypothetical protein